MQHGAENRLCPAGGEAATQPCDVLFRFNFREPIGEPMAFPEQGQASSGAFAFRMRFTAVALSVTAGRIS